MANNIMPSKPNPIAQPPASLSSATDNVLRRATQFNPVLSKLPQVREVQGGFAELAALYNALPLTSSPDPKLAQARQALAQARANFGQRVETQLYQALFKEMKKLQTCATWGMAFSSPLLAPVMQYLWSKTRQRLPQVYQPVAELLEQQGWPNMKAQVLHCIKDIDNAMGINTATMQQSAAAASRDAAILAQAQQSALQTMNQVNQQRVQSAERSSDAFDAYIRG
jgi:hypothetical protein